MRNKFDEQLLLLNNKMIEMGAMCESLIAFTSTALLSGNVKRRPMKLKSEVAR